MGPYKIDEVSKASGLTKRTIRYYEELGLMPPPSRTDGGMRLYTQEHIDRLKQIVNARDILGSSLQEIQAFVAIREELQDYKKAYGQTVDKAEKRRQLEKTRPMIEKQLQMLDEKLEKMTQFRRDIGQIYQRVCIALDQEHTPNEGV
ncbi:transcriptional regulator, MerR family [Paenibacillus curdlanolyticus YK9]|uniref:Transcriptional regulator, MerR family n=1 Tax=Paenibacillus curdlanolyticus YK9 TaxID=717606 RepID=E0IG23_9BACL|nr:MerR family transcriptional regulator [Paenibacillus curdlanolyticus]EFM08603.1 transcriptional regulator, MerR family [Paenibacillus curdlanolyticus YK9]